MTNISISNNIFYQVSNSHISGRFSNKKNYALTLTVGSNRIFDLIELEMRHAASAFRNTLSALGTSSSWLMVRCGFSIISLIMYLLPTISSLPYAFDVNLENASLDCSAMARKVVIRQLLTAAVNRCSGDQLLSMPPGN